MDRPTTLGIGLDRLDVMTEPAHESGGPDWIIGLNLPIRQPMVDPRLGAVQADMRSLQPQLAAIFAKTQEIESVLRQCADDGMTRDEIASQASLPMEAVVRVLRGGSVFGWSAQ